MPEIAVIPRVGLGRSQSADSFRPQHPPDIAGTSTGALLNDRISRTPLATVNGYRVEHPDGLAEDMLAIPEADIRAARAMHFEYQRARLLDDLIIRRRPPAQATRLHRTPANLQYLVNRNTAQYVRDALYTAAKRAYGFARSRSHNDLQA